MSYRGLLDPAMTALLSQTSSNERRDARYHIDAAVQIAVGGFGIEFKIRDVSLTGISLQTDGLVNMNTGDICNLTLPGYGDVQATVVVNRTDTFHLCFVVPRNQQVQAFIRDSNAEPLPQ